MVSQPQVFEISEVATILGMPVSKVKNWTIGRPLKIKPSVRVAKGRGKRNLYGRKEVFLFGLARHLSEDGLDVGVINEIIATFQRDDELPTLKYRYLGFHRPISKGMPDRLRRYELLDENRVTDAAEHFQESFSFYICDLKKLDAYIEELISHAQIFIFPVLPTNADRRPRSKRGK